MSYRNRYRFEDSENEEFYTPRIKETYDDNDDYYEEEDADEYNERYVGYDDEEDMRRYYESEGEFFHPKHTQRFLNRLKNELDDVVHDFSKFEDLHSGTGLWPLFKDILFNIMKYEIEEYAFQVNQKLES